MNEFTFNAKEELKRVDHLIYVSLKYTRTGDVLKSVIDRLVGAYDFVLDGFLYDLHEDKKIENIPHLPGIKAELVQKYLKENKVVSDAIKFYVFLRKVKISGFTSTSEFRRNVTMTVSVENKPVEITIDVVMEYYKQTLDFMEYLEDKNILSEYSNE